MNLNWVVDAVSSQVPLTEPDRIALSFDGTVRTTYGELEEGTRRYARALRDLGLNKGDRLGLLLYNDAEYPALLMAAARLGVIVVRLNFRLTAAEVEFILSDSGASVVIVHSSLLDRVAPVREKSGVASVVVVADSDDPIPDWAQAFEELKGKDALTRAELPVVAPSDPLCLIYTSGTTGLPKGAIWSHANTVNIAAMQALRWQFGKDTVALVPGPIYHAGGFEAVFLPALLMQGRAVYLQSGGFSTDRFLEVLQAEQVTDCLLFPFILTDLLHRDDLEHILPKSLRRFILGGDMLMPSTAQEVKRRLPHIKLCQVFGLTEGGAIATTLEDDDFLTQPKSIGRPLPLGEARVIREDDTLADVDEVGEIEVRNAGVCAGYWNRPEANAATFYDGWCRTGDLGYVNADGFLHLSGRAKDMIRSGGENIYPAEIEKVLSAHPAVQATAVVGVPDTRFTEVGCAVVVAEPGPTPDPAELRAFCREQLAGYKVPKYFVFVDELPMNASGKVLKYQLRHTYADIEARSTGEKSPA
ncbi:long-chain fatty acid--CoA ligase [Skermania sp. ID1734]|uniref:class I adenylate-forming enzyme family protein n=1 Tax=Skermania sp. ID1734 TaxID=2597516 RepID=UPI00117D6460|nr:AMP-binding protein [Skermania sp. ID1734]TSD94091.1 long-chain fatty acid--CoA ligase [Skermania sp. ID1734]